MKFYKRKKKKLNDQTKFINLSRQTTTKIHKRKALLIKTETLKWKQSKYICDLKFWQAVTLAKQNENLVQKFLSDRFLSVDWHFHFSMYFRSFSREQDTSDRSEIKMKLIEDHLSIIKPDDELRKFFKTTLDKLEIEKIRLVSKNSILSSII